MKIGVPAEIMNSEGRVALSPAAAQALVDDGHEVLIQCNWRNKCPSKQILWRPSKQA